MGSLSRAFGRQFRQLQPGTKDKLLFWGTATAGVATAAGAWLLI
jgi:hypothetical protein